MFDHPTRTSRTGAMQPRINPSDPRLRQMRKGLLDAFENVLVAVLGDSNEFEFAVEEMASIETAIRLERLRSPVTQLPFTYMPSVDIPWLITAFTPDTDSEDTSYYAAIAVLLWTFRGRVGKTQHDFANNILQWVEQHWGGPEFLMGHDSFHVLRLLQKERPERRTVVARYVSMSAGERLQLRDAIHYLTVQRKKKFWAEFIDTVDGAQAAAVFERVTCREFNDENSAPLLELCPTLAIRSLDRLLLLGALRRRLTGPPKHWFQRVGPRKPYLEFVAREAVDFAVETVRSRTPHRQEALDAISYAFGEITRVLMRTFPPPDPQAIRELHIHEQCRTVAQAAGFSSKHGDVLFSALQGTRVFSFREIQDNFSARYIVPPLTALVVRSVRIDDARRFLEQTVLGGGVPAAPHDFEKAIKKNAAPNWPQRVQLGLLMRLNLPPREPRISPKVLTPAPAPARVLPPRARVLTPEEDNMIRKAFRLPLRALAHNTAVTARTVPENSTAMHTTTESPVTAIVAIPPPSTADMPVMASSSAVIVHAPAAKLDMPGAPSVTVPAIAPIPVIEGPLLPLMPAAGRMQRRARNCERCLTM